jgi:hypothetical protein
VGFCAFSRAGSGKAVLPDPAGSAVAVARNITERKRAEEEIRRLNESLERRVALRTTRLAEREARLCSATKEEGRSVAYEVLDQMIVAVQQHPHGVSPSSILRTAHEAGRT